MADDTTRNRVYESGPPYPADAFLDLANQGMNRLDVQRLQVIKNYDTAAIQLNFHYKPYKTVWRNHWLHMGGRMPGGEAAVLQGPFDLVYVRCWEECPYLERLRDLLERITQPDFDLSSLTANHLSCHRARFDYMYLYNRQTWGKDLFDESLFRSRAGRDSNTGAEYRPYFWGWNMQEFHEFRLWYRACGGVW